ncbi:uncharacterized protein LOC110707352 [Chenopodium quinoa]|uniref:uncharacterized protein LOC110707352 n=1 Tax=Chenopodium quinoa TaxID=63459 RepID=UPI000B78F23F|nr:uncharacterized protein LOC110707352 [Chenopodium quinoa]
MPPPAVSVDSRPPSDFNFNSQNGPTNAGGARATASATTATHFSNGCSFNTGSSSSSSTSLPAVGRVSSSARPKPRLVKQRKSSKSSSGLSEPGSGINPFRSVSSVNVDTPNCSNSDSNSFVSQFQNVGFVFGVSNSNTNDSNSINSNKFNVDCNVAAEASIFGFRDSNLHKQEFSFSENKANKDNYSSDGVAFSFGASAKDQIGGNTVKNGEIGAELLNELQKLKIEKERCDTEDNVSHKLNNLDATKGGDQPFVFKTGGESSDGCGEGSVPLKSDVNAKNLFGNGEGIYDGKMRAFGSRNFDDSAFVFGSIGNFAKTGDSSSQSSAFPAENDGTRVNEDVLSSSFSFSSLEAETCNAKPEVHSSSSERKVESSSSGLPEGFGVSFSEFELPQDAPLSFSANFTSGLGRKAESYLKTRGLKDKNLRKTKGKPKQSKPTKLHPVQTPLSSEGASATPGQEASECYSPMDFSPYEDTNSNNDVPITSHHETCQTKVTTEKPFAVRSESELHDSSTDIRSKINGYGGNEFQFSISSDKASRDAAKFTFTTSTAAQDHVSSLKRLHRKKYRMKPVSITSGASRVRGSSMDSTPLLSKLQGAGGNFFSSSKDKRETEAGEEHESEAYSGAEKACEKWRRRGNEAYEKGELSKAEEFYTWGVNCIPPGAASDATFRPLVRCYSNRAATRMALGRVREAIQDCNMAVKLDASFHRAQIRAGNCYLLLGEVDEAMQCFGKYMGDGNVICLDRKVVISASDGIQKSQKVIECTRRSAELLKLKTSEAASDALQHIAEALAISINSEKLLEMKAQALCMLSRHEEAIALCQKTLDFAEKNFRTATSRNIKVDGSSNESLWRYRTLSKCQFHLGNLEVALDLLEKHVNKAQGASDPLALTIHELLKQKSAGNTAFHSGKHAEAIEHYTSAILSGMEARPFAAICFCNRAAAHQALGQIPDAISDCSLAIALDENYAKAVSRRATLHEMIRDYKQTAADLRRLLSLHQKQSAEKSKQSGSGNGKELRQLQQRLYLMEEETKRDTPLDLYLILGVTKSDTVSEIKKAYRKAALRHHPDKAAQSLVKSGEVGEEGRHWKDIADLVHKDSDRLFKIIGEAYAVLSDPTKREEYDNEEDMRKALKENSNIRTNSRRYSEHYSQGYPFERSSSRRYWQDSYKTYTHSYRR